MIQSRKMQPMNGTPPGTSRTFLQNDVSSALPYLGTSLAFRLIPVVFKQEATSTRLRT